MSDIFISYKREEQTIAKKLADALKKKGRSVWWDPKLRSGERFDDVIEKALKNAKSVIVMWSKLSVGSQYVRDEAAYALKLNKLVPIKIEEVDLPFRFAGIQTENFINWDGSHSFPGLQKLNKDISNILDSKSPPPPPPPPQKIPFSVVVPVGGQSGTFFPIKVGMPKPLMLIDTKPMIHHVLDSLLSGNSFDKIIILGNHFSKAIKACTDSYKNLREEKIIFKDIDAPVPKALRSFSSEIKKPILYYSCDILIEKIDWFDVYWQYQNLKKNYSVIGMFLHSFYYPLQIGVIKSDITYPNLLKEFYEKPDELENKSAHIGVFLFEPKLINEFVKAKDKSLEKDTIPRAIKKGEKFGLYQVGKWQHIQEIRDYYNIQKKYFPNELKD